MVRTLGFVQIDSINFVERAHHLILGARLDGYRPAFLNELLASRDLFEHWTHDASVIPLEHFPCWRHRFDRFEEKMKNRKWWQERRGSEALQLERSLLERIEKEGPLPTRAFRRAGAQRGKWWGWTPAKAALEHLWRTGRLMIADRLNFEKVYDLTERVVPSEILAQQVSRSQMVDWSCGQAIERLGVATSGELADFWCLVTRGEAEQWSRENLTTVEIEGERFYARPDWPELSLPDPPSRIRLLAPFDPLVRNRNRLSWLFGFDYRFEAFVPAARRTYGYYVIPLLEGEQLVGRLSPRFDRKKNRLEVLGLWWEPGVRLGRGRKQRLESELGRICRRLGADDYTWVGVSW